jgi:hypothetical protein
VGDPRADDLEGQLGREAAERDEVDELERRGETSDTTKEDPSLEQDQEDEQIGEVTHFAVVVDLVDDVLEGEYLDEEALVDLPDREVTALRVLEEVVSGKAADERDLLAEERLEMLNLALAALQPALAAGLDPELESTREEYLEVVEELQELRDYLERLADAQDEERAEEEKEEAAGQDDDDDEQEAEEPQEKEEKAEKSEKELRAEKRAKANKSWAKKPKHARPSTPAPDPGPKPDPDLGIPPRPSTLSGAPDEPAVERASGPSTVWDGDPRAR